MKRILALLLLVAISMMGCNFNPATKATSIKLPKDVTVKQVSQTYFTIGILLKIN